MKQCIYNTLLCLVPRTQMTDTRVFRKQYKFNPKPIVRVGILRNYQAPKGPWYNYQIPKATVFSFKKWWLTLVTAFADGGRYAKPKPSLKPNVDNIFGKIVQWKFSF